MYKSVHVCVRIQFQVSCLSSPLRTCCSDVRQVGDGTTSVVILAGEFLKEAKTFVEEGAHPRVRGLTRTLMHTHSCKNKQSDVLAHALLCTRPYWAAAYSSMPAGVNRHISAHCIMNAFHVTSQLSPLHLFPALPTQSIMKAFRIASQLAIEKVRELSVSLEGKSDEEKKSLLKKCAMTTLNSKLVGCDIWQKCEHATRCAL